MKKLLCGASGVALLTAFAMTPAIAQTETDEEDEVMVVTGSFIEGAVEDAALPVSVVGRETLEEIGSPTIAELLRNLPETQGLIAETNQFDTRGGQGNEGATTINLRGLGSARTLVLMNGHRHVASDTIGVDVSFIPGNAIERIEVLKDGAAALYGSDAVAGVVNFITRNDFQGLEVGGSYQFIDDSDGDFDINAIFGHGGDNWNFMVAAEYSERSELQIRDRDWALLPFGENPQGGWSSIGNPGSVFNLATGGFVPDPNCNNLGGFFVPGSGRCFFQYTYFDNLIEDTESIKVYSNFDYEFGDGHVFHIEGAYAEVDIPEWNTSPSYPPQTLLTTQNLVLPNHPGWADLKAQNPAYAANFPPGGAVFYWGRYAGVAGVNGGQPETSQRLTEQFRVSAGLEGALFDGEVNYDLNVAFSERERTLASFGDMRVERFSLGLRGLGGPNCDPNTGTPGVGGCEYFNPFSNAIERSVVNGAVNPQYNPDVANSPELLDWLTGRGTSVTTNQLFVADLVFSGDTGIALPGGTIGYAVGGQLRKDYFEFEISDLYNLEKNPCPFTQPVSVALGFTNTLDCAAPSGLFAFLAGSTPTSLDRNVYGTFAEFALPVFDNLDVQLAVRYEDYGGDVGSTIDPKIAARWQATEWLALRGSASTTFRGPSQSFLQGRVTNLSFIDQPLAFKALDTVGNPGLKAESALATNFGVLLNYGGLTGSIDYWRFDFEDPFQTENGQQIANAYQANGCQDGGAGVGTPVCDSLRQQIFPLGVDVAQLERIDRSVINGADIVTSGIDFNAAYNWQMYDFDLTVGGSGTYTLEYESEDFVNIDGVKLADGGDFVGFLNEGTPFQPLIELRGNLFARAAYGPHTLTYQLYYTDEYEDVAPSIPSLGTIDSHVTHDIHYVLDLFDGNTRFSASIFNLTDEDPPAASTDLSYDAFTHNPFGRMIKLGITQTIF